MSTHKKIEQCASCHCPRSWHPDDGPFGPMKTVDGVSECTGYVESTPLTRLALDSSSLEHRLSALAWAMRDQSATSRATIDAVIDEFERVQQLYVLKIGKLLDEIRDSDVNTRRHIARLANLNTLED